MPKHDKEKYREFREKVWLRDYGQFIETRLLSQKDEWKKACCFWKCLSKEEQDKFEKLNSINLWLCKTIDVAHIKDKSTHPQYKYDESNAFLLNTFTHGFLDTYRDPFTGNRISSDERIFWFERIFNARGLNK